MTRLCIHLTVLLTSLLGASPLGAAPPSFSRDIRPILSDNCYQCHGPDDVAREADLRLDQKAGVLAAVGDVGDVNGGELLRRITTNDADEMMPPPSSRRSLNTSQRELIRDWIEAGAKWEDHWSFQTPHRPSLPITKNSSWSSNAIDRFVVRRLDVENLKPSALASRETRIRRVTLDLTGLPPTLAEIDAFVADRSPNAYQQVVERLLASPRFGERMSMHWLDVARYADTNGYQGDRERTMWPWRDWVIDALNRNLPYDQFTEWQLAGDLIPDATQQQKLATGFCRNHMINGEGGRIAEENRVEYIFDQIETVGTVWMGVTVQCCRCHDHKFDPIAQQEYYKLFAFFNQTPVNGGGGDPQTAPNLPVPTRRQRQHVQQLERSLTNAMRSLKQAEEESATCNADAQPKDVTEALKQSLSSRSEDQWKKLEEHFASHPQVVSLGKAYRRAHDKLNETRSAIPKVMIMQDMAKDKWRKTPVLTKGLYNQPQHNVTADTPAFLPPLPEKSRDRLALARWLTSTEHPLTARVTVNRIWQLFFGNGIVKTTEDFGVQGEQPTHPDLLDWLARELADSDWDTKHLIRLILMSSTYQQSNRFSEAMHQRDPENRLLSRGPRMRMPSWMIRDHALATSGVMTDQMGGPSVKPYQPAGIWEETSFGNKKYQQDHGAALYRRSLYVYWRRIVGPTMFFDTAKRQTCSVRPGRTNTPLHALVTLNDPAYVEAARIMATRVMGESTRKTTRLKQAFRLATSRHPNEDELKLLTERLDQLNAHYATHHREAIELCEVGDSPVPTNLDMDQLASYSTMCLLILNLDEALSK